MHAKFRLCTSSIILCTYMVLASIINTIDFACLLSYHVPLFFSSFLYVCMYLIVCRHPKNTNVVESMVKALARVVSSIQVYNMGSTLHFIPNPFLFTCFIFSNSTILINKKNNGLILQVQICGICFCNVVVSSS